MALMSICIDDFEPEWRRYEDDCEGGFGTLSPHEVGREGEDLAAAYLADTGYDVIERNWRCRFGEVDIVAEDGDTTVLVEVKTRLVWGEQAKAIPELAVDFEKKERYRKLAHTYMSQNEECRKLRVDVIAISLTPEHEGQIRHLCGALAWDE